MFGVHLPHPVVQTALKDKTPFIAKRHIIYYYGDSDSDITAAVGAKVVRIRVQRLQASYAKDVPHDGQLNEIVLENSRECRQVISRVAKVAAFIVAQLAQKLAQLAHTPPGGENTRDDPLKRAISAGFCIFEGQRPILATTVRSCTE
jgi:hypothetical protein